MEPLQQEAQELGEFIPQDDDSIDIDIEHDDDGDERMPESDADKDVDRSSDISIDSDDDEYDYDVGSNSLSPQSKRFGGEGKKVYTCHECKYVTDRKNNLKRHVVTMHERCTKVLECCDRVFMNKASLREHVVSCHKNGYDCRICGRNFCRKALLKRHITVHSGQKDFVCNVCGYATSHKSNLDRHKRRHIPKELRHRYPIEKTGRRRQDKERHPAVASFPRLADFRKIGHYADTSGTENHLPAALFGSPFGCFASPMGDYSFLRNAIPRQLWKPPQKVPFKRWMLPDEDHGKGAIKGECPENMYSNTHMVPQFLSNSAGTLDLSMPRTGNEMSNTAGDFDSQQKANRKRLFPALHRCKGCEKVFENQLQLTRHVDQEHPTASVVAPQRPLTLLIRPKAVLPWRFF